ncbi:MAG TPA: DUF4384 domain-containing protein, partial [Longimicrobium sp.]|uniref:DUF4384 domain-containing protein n=1 Tax=Longimicrobium sp. TaxID=2029185 RepID=UPI002EDB2A96
MKTRLLAASLTLAALGAVPAVAEPAPLMPATLSAASSAALALQYDGVRVWVNGGDVFRSGDRMRVNVRTDRDGYLAVFHIDTNGDLDVLYPRSYNDDGWVDGGRTLSLGSRGGWDYLRVRGGVGVGYVFAVMLDEPLELWRVRDMYRPRYAGWDASRSIYGDPFYAMDEIVRAVVPDDAYGYESTDYYTYNIGRRYRYPRYACYDGYGDWYTRVSYYDYDSYGCDRVRIFLGHNPYYYDTRYFRGSRRIYYGEYYRTRRERAPLHGYKERTSANTPMARSGYS